MVSAHDFELCRSELRSSDEQLSERCESTLLHRDRRLLLPIWFLPTSEPPVDVLDSLCSICIAHQTIVRAVRVCVHSSFTQDTNASRSEGKVTRYKAKPQ